MKWVKGFAIKPPSLSWDLGALLIIISSYLSTIQRHENIPINVKVQHWKKTREHVILWPETILEFTWILFSEYNFNKLEFNPINNGNMTSSICFHYQMPQTKAKISDFGTRDNFSETSVLAFFCSNTCQ